MTKDNNFRLEFPTDTEVMGADMSEPPKPPTVASQESDVNGVSDFSVFEDYGDYSNEIPVPPKNTGKIVAIVIAAIVVIALIGGIACWMLSNNSKKSAITSAAAQCQDSTSQLQSANNTLSDVLEIGKPARRSLPIKSPTPAPSLSLMRPYLTRRKRKSCRATRRRASAS